MPSTRVESRFDTPTVAGADGDRAVPVVLAGAPAGTVPSVFRHTRESADVLLPERGLDVRYDKQLGLGWCLG